MSSPVALERAFFGVRCGFFKCLGDQQQVQCIGHQPDNRVWKQIQPALRCARARILSDDGKRRPPGSSPRCVNFVFRYLLTERSERGGEDVKTQRRNPGLYFLRDLRDRSVRALVFTSFSYIERFCRLLPCQSKLC